MQSPIQIKLPKIALILILGLLSMLMPLSIDMYLPSMPTIVKDYGVADGIVQLTISFYLLGFALGQLIYGPLTDSFGRKSVLSLGLTVFIVAAMICGLSQSINQLITARFFHGLAAASTAVVINALMRDIYHDRDEFSRMMSFVTLISNIAPLLAPILGGIVLIWFDWHIIFYVLSITALFALLLVMMFIPETLPKTNRMHFSLMIILKNVVNICRHRQVLNYMLTGAFSGAGMFSFLSLGPFVYMNIYGVASHYFGYYFALNIIVMIFMNMINSRFVKQKGANSMLKLGLTIQSIMAICLLFVYVFKLGFIPLVICVAGYIGCTSIIAGNAMAIILSHYAYIAGTAASLTGTFRFVVAGGIGILLALFANEPEVILFTDTGTDGILQSYYSQQSELLMVGSMVICNVIAGVFFLLSRQKSKTERAI